MDELEILKKKLARERAARKEAERLLEIKALELYRANQELQHLNAGLQEEVAAKTRELQQQKARLQTVIDSAQDIMFVISPEGHFRFINPMGQKLSGLPNEALIGRHFLEFVRKDYHDRVRSFYLSQQKEGRTTSYLEFPVVNREGKEIWLGQHVSLIYENGELVELTAIARDITERKKAQEALSTLNTRLSIILESLQEGILVEDETRHIVLVNQEFCDIFQMPVPPAALIGADCSQSAEQSKHLFRDPAHFIALIEDLLEQRRISPSHTLETVDGRILEMSYTPIFRKEEYIGHLWRYQDVTESHLSQRKLQKSEEKYRGIMENMELGLMEVDNAGVITKAYERFCKMTGYQPEELIGKNAREVFLPEEFARIMDEQDRQRLKGTAGVYEIQMTIKGGKKIWAMISGAPFYDEKGNMVGSIGIHYDITYQKVLQKELEEARKIAEKARDAEKEFLANMSHEIRNPINSIIGMANLLYDTSLTPEQLEYLNNIKHSSDILLALVSDVLDISKITEGKMDINLQEFDPVELFTALGKTTEFRLRQKAQVAFHMHLDSRLPHRLLGDPTLLNQVFLNLLGNAFKFTHEGRITFEVSVEKEEPETVVLKMEVSDTGIGIETYKQEQIFERFSQAGKAHEYGGTGLGLPITKKLIELQDGQIRVESQAGQGTRFIVEIPFAKAAAGERPGSESPLEDKLRRPD